MRHARDPWGPTDAHRGVTRPLEENGEVVLIFFRVQSKFQTGHFIHKNFSLDRSNARTTLLKQNRSLVPQNTWAALAVPSRPLRPFLPPTGRGTDKAPAGGRGSEGLGSGPNPGRAAAPPPALPTPGPLVPCPLSADPPVCSAPSRVPHTRGPLPPPPTPHRPFRPPHLPASLATCTSAPRSDPLSPRSRGHAGAL